MTAHGRFRQFDANISMAEMCRNLPNYSEAGMAVMCICGTCLV